MKKKPAREQRTEDRQGADPEGADPKASTSSILLGLRQVPLNGVRKNRESSYCGYEAPYGKSYGLWSNWGNLCPSGEQRIRGRPLFGDRKELEKERLPVEET